MRIRLVLRRPFAVLLLGAAVAAFTAGCGGGDDGGDAASGETIYAQQCARCHGADGRGNLGPSLIGISERFQEPSTQELFVSNGGGGMPTFGQILSEDQIRDVVAYTRQQFG